MNSETSVTELAADTVMLIKAVGDHMPIDVIKDLAKRAQSPLVKKQLEFILLGRTIDPT